MTFLGDISPVTFAPSILWCFEISLDRSPNHPLCEVGDFESEISNEGFLYNELSYDYNQYFVHIFYVKMTSELSKVMFCVMQFLFILFIFIS